MWVDTAEYKAAGAVLAIARREAGCTQQALAARIKKPQSFVASIERGQRRVDVLELVVIAEALGQNAAKLFARMTKAVVPSKIRLHRR
jgi:transcriptional regulator with XRE-family HTH domain